ncbi:MAG TPA: S41 family peptidase [Verrucomicrobiae bacterium]|jgi:carboxyl-terminal processing protease
MMRLLNQVSLALLLALATVRAAEQKDLPKFEDLSGLIRSNLPGVTDAEIDRAAAQGVLNHFKGRVVLGNGKAATTNGIALVSRSTVYDGAIAYLRVARVEDGAAAKVSAALDKLAAKQKPKGLVLDLRYASGSDYAAAAAVADFFVAKEQLLIDWGGGKARSTAKDKPIKLPLAVLINSQTRGAAEALAAILRQSASALIIGNNTAGEASMFNDFTLAEGQKVRLAAGSVKLGNGEALSIKGVAPDLAVSVTSEEERAYFSDPFKSPRPVIAKVNGATNSSSTNQPFRRINEAELVRLQREGNLPDDDSPLPAATGKAAPAKPVLRDPALTRALDVLKALAIVQPGRAP